MGTCLDNDHVLALLEGRLSKADLASTQDHVDRCNACRALIAEVARSSTEALLAARRPSAAEDERSVRSRNGTGTAANERTATKRLRLVPGAVLADRFRLQRLLGEGGAGVVWEATHTVMRQPVALKLLKSDDEEGVKRFFREARITAALKHPHIVEVTDAFVLPESGTPVMVMELLVGAPLSSWLHRAPLTPPSPLALRDVARALLQVVAATSAAHSVGVVHRDLKPENVFLLGHRPSLADPHVKVLDFGLAKLTATEGAVASTARLTKTGCVLGTPHYMSPEQVVASGTIDHRADVWALGVILYECLAGVRPVDGANRSQVFRAIVSAKIVPLAKLVPNLPPAMGKLVGRMLSRAQKDRPSLQEIYAALAHEAS